MDTKQFIIWAICIVYCLSPVDLAPGPVDDAIALAATVGLTKLFNK